MDLQQVVDNPRVPVAKGKSFEPAVVALVRSVAAVVDTVATDRGAVQVVSTQWMVVA